MRLLTLRRRRMPADAGGVIAISESEPAPDDAAERDALAALIPEVRRADRFSASDLVSEATADIGSRPGRLAMTILGTVLGIGSLVATWGFAQTASAQVQSQFDAVASTRVTITAAERSAGREATAAIGRVPWDAPSRVGRLAGVRAAALTSPVDIKTGEITAVPVNDPSAVPAAPPAVIAASGDLVGTVGAELLTGRSFDDGHDRRRDRVTVLGDMAAEQLGVSRVDTQPSIFIDGLAYAVVGVIGESAVRGDLRGAVIIPTGAARADFGLQTADALTIWIDVGAGPQIEQQAPLALDPAAPETFDVRAPQATSSLGSAVQSDVNIVFVVVGAVALLAGGLGIANVTLLSVTERRGEIGLRRAIGATRRQIGAQFMVESVVIGLLGGLIGAALAVLTVVIVAACNQWTAVIDPLVAFAGVGVGALVGLAAGWYPARRASSVEPVEALRAS